MNDEMRLYVFFPSSWTEEECQAAYFEHWGPAVVRDEFAWSVVVKARRFRCRVLVAGGKVDLSGLGLRWEEQREFEQALRDALRQQPVCQFA